MRARSLRAQYALQDDTWTGLNSCLLDELYRRTVAVERTHERYFYLACRTKGVGVLPRQRQMKIWTDGWRRKLSTGWPGGVRR